MMKTETELLADLPNGSYRIEYTATKNGSKTISIYAPGGVLVARDTSDDLPEGMYWYDGLTTSD